jgi:hypothetical protein
MRIGWLTCLVSMVPLSVALAQTAAPSPPSFLLPRAYAGYTQPEISGCRMVSASRRECIVPAMVAGRYLIEAAGVATATGANATQSLGIQLGARPCISTPKAPFTGKANLHLVCEATFLTDQPITVAANYAADNATMDPAGPLLVMRRLPWNGVVEAQGAIVHERPKEGPPPGAAPKR